MRIFLAGHKGMVGGAILRKLEARGASVITRDRQALDLTTQAEVGRFLQAEKPDVVILAAAKVGGIGATGLGSAALADLHRSDTGGLDTVIGGAVVASAANMANLLDLRPGRALKVTVVASAVVLAAAGRPGGDRRGTVPAAAALGAALVLLGPDLRGEAMLGDTGANAAGALVGVALVDRCGRIGRLLALGALTGLTLASEKVSFTSVIESTPVLRDIDAWGRPPR